MTKLCIYSCIYFCIALIQTRKQKNDNLCYLPSVRRRRWRLERMCAGVCSLWWLWSKEAASASVAWRLSWRRFWRISSHSTHQVCLPPRLPQQHYQPSVINSLITTSCFCLYRDGFGAETHGVLRPVQRCSGFAEWSGCLNRGGTRCSCHYLARQEGEGFSYPASSHSLLLLPCISTTHDAHHGSMHYSVLQPWYQFGLIWHPFYFCNFLIFLNVSSCMVYDLLLQ